MYKVTKIKDLPIDSRPYERCFMYGPEALSDLELMAIIINAGTKNKSSYDIAKDILLKVNSISDISKLHIEELLEIEGIGRKKAILIKSICELGRRTAKAYAKEKMCFDNPATIVDYYGVDLRKLDRENLMMIALNTKSVFIDDFLISEGTVNASIASPREIFIDALKVKAVSIILIHNHPSGDDRPSREDIVVTRKIKEAGELIGINLIDHIIIGDNSYFSFKEKGYL